MKLRLRLSSDRFRQLLHTPTAALRWLMILALCGYAVYMFLFLYETVYRTLIVPKPIDQELITARQEKVNRQQLNAVKAFDDQKRSAEVPQAVKNPF